MVLPWGEKTHAVTKLLPFFELSGNTYVVVVYASPPLNLRLSPGDRAEGVDGNSDAYNTRIPVSLHRAGRVRLLEVARFIKFAGAILFVLADTVLKE